MSTSVSTRCYTPLKTNFYIKQTKDQYEIRRDSFEIDVFQASSYYSGIRKVPSTMRIIFRRMNNLIFSMRRHSINLVRHNDQLEEPKKKNKKIKKLQPGSPGAKLATYLHSLLNQTNLLVLSKPKKNKPRLFEDDKKSSRSSSMSLARCADVAETTSVRSCPTYTSHTRPTPTPKSAHTKPGYRDLRSYSSASSKKSDLLDAETLEAGGSRWPALTWFDQELKIRKGVVSYSVKGLKKVKEEDDGGESDSSSDLFELQNHDLRGQAGELPVHQTTTNMNNIKARK
ncbi:hypothetical protein QQ045_033499 [Rhodiola kirilowii]